MKNSIPLLVLAGLVVGCASEETDLAVAPQPSATTAAVDISLALPPVTAPAAFDPLTVPASATPAAAVPLVNEAEKRAELADLTEKVYLRWNAALEDYRKKHNRLPQSLPELQQFHPVLASLPPPRGFALTLDPQAGEIFVVHAPRVPGSGAGHPANRLPPPLAIP